jgi:hypothetical protein
MGDLGEGDEKKNQIAGQNVQQHEPPIGSWGDARICAYETCDKRREKQQGPEKVLSAADEARGLDTDSSYEQRDPGYNRAHRKDVRPGLV